MCWNKLLLINRFDIVVNTLDGEEYKNGFKISNLDKNSQIIKKKIININ